MSRLALFTVAFIIIVAIGSQSRHDGGKKNSICVCIPSRAGLLLKSAIVKTQTQSAQLFAQ
jgi:hypothetical protein